MAVRFTPKDTSFSQTPTVRFTPKSEPRPESGTKQFLLGAGQSLLEQTPDVAQSATAGVQANPLMKPLQYGLEKARLTGLREGAISGISEYERPVSAGGQFARGAGRVVGYAPTILGAGQGVKSAVGLAKRIASEAPEKNIKTVYNSAKKIISELGAGKDAYGKPVGDTINKYGDIKPTPLGAEDFSDLTPSIRSKITRLFDVKWNQDGSPVNNVKNYWKLKRGLDEHSQFGPDADIVKSINTSIGKKVKQRILEVVPEVSKDFDAYSGYMTAYDEIIPTVTRKTPKGRKVDERKLVGLLASDNGSSEFKMALEGAKKMLPEIEDAIFNLKKVGIRQTLTKSGVGRASLLDKAFALRGMTPYKNIPEVIPPTKVPASTAIVPYQAPPKTQPYTPRVINQGMDLPPTEMRVTSEPWPQTKAIVPYENPNVIRQGWQPEARMTVTEGKRFSMPENQPMSADELKYIRLLLKNPRYEI